MCTYSVCVLRSLGSTDREFRDVAFEDVGFDTNS